MTYPARTIAGDEVQIAEKTSDPQRGDVLTDTDGLTYVLDYATGHLIPTEDAPVADSSLTETEEANAHKDPEKAPEGEPIFE